MEHHKYNDAILNFYYSEMNNDYNDGWWKQYHKVLFENRLSQLNPEFKPTTYRDTFLWRDCYSAFINLDHREDRLEKMVAELQRVGIKAERIRGMLPEEYSGDMSKVQKMWDRTKGAIGCHYSQVKIMEIALSKNKSAFVMEDDLVFGTDAQKRLDHAQKFLNENDWDVFWLGGTYHLNPPRWHDAEHSNSELRDCDCNLNRDVECTNDPHIVRTYGCWSTYAYIVNVKSIPKILDLLEKNIHSSIGIDWLFIKLQPQLKCFAFAPAIAKQYDNQSNIGDGITEFSNFANLGAYWWADKIEDFNPMLFDWHEAKIN